ncbi:hypothetical protein LUZ60_001928 [Juncus effusus]|nr:hypothetical protein LUZ60_001928 [Juncus effusus]
MKISELSPDPNRTSSSSFSHLESLITSLESFSSSSSSSPTTSLSTLSTSLRKHLTQLASLRPFPAPSQLRLWKLSFRLWNSCVDIFNSDNSSSQHNNNIVLAEIRHCAADLLLVAGISSEIPSGKIKAASFLHRTGLIWHELGRSDRASECFEKATDLVDGAAGDEEEKQLALDLNLARSQTAWENSDRTLAIALLNRSKSFLTNSVLPNSYKSLAEQYLSYGKLLLSSKQEISNANSNPNTSPTASDLFSEALEICEKSLTISPNPDSDLQTLKDRCLRFLAAERLQNQDYEGALKCVRVLRSGPQTPQNPAEHPSVGYVAMKGWIGAKNVKEAERELMGLVKNKEAPEGVVVSAAEEYLGFAGGEAARAVLLALAGRCRAGGAEAAVRVVRRVLEGGAGSMGRGRAAAELAADQRVLSLFDGEDKERERSGMHALLWNCGAEHFRMHNYELSAELFERSMLYVLHDEENRSRRANCFRVLSLCHLAASQLDRAQEFINQADKLEPSIRCAFIKFKIHLKKREEEQAIKILQSLINYTDFQPEFLTISTHESLQNKFPKIAIVSLSTLLSLYTPKKPMPVSEISLIRNLIALLLRETGTETEILKYLKLVRTRMNENKTENLGFREISWFAGNSWNLGLKMGREMRCHLCKEFLELAADFYGFRVGNENNNNEEMVCKCLVLSVGAILSLEESKMGVLSDFDVKKGFEMLERARKLLPSIPPDQSPAFHFLHTYNSYQLLSKPNPNSNPNFQTLQTQLIKSYASSKHSTPTHLFHLGLIASQNPNPNFPASQLAFQSSLSSFLSLPSPNYHSISIIIRKLINISTHNDDVAYDLYKRAYSIILGLKEGEYPLEEGKWVAMSCWNRGGISVRLRQGERGRKWMKLGLDFAKRLRGMERYVKGMEECLESFERVCEDREDTGENGNNHESNNSNNKQLVLV